MGDVVRRGSVRDDRNALRHVLRLEGDEGEEKERAKPQQGEADDLAKHVIV